MAGWTVNTWLADFLFRKHKNYPAKDIQSILLGWIMMTVVTVLVWVITDHNNHTLSPGNVGDIFPSWLGTPWPVLYLREPCANSDSTSSSWIMRTLGRARQPTQSVLMLRKNVFFCFVIITITRCGRWQGGTYREVLMGQPAWLWHRIHRLT